MNTAVTGRVHAALPCVVCLAVLPMRTAVTATHDPPAAVQAPATGQLADAAYQAKDWSKALSLYQRLVKEQPASAIGWLRLGSCLHKAGQNARALEALTQASTLGAPPPSVQYQIALVRAAMSDRDAAFTALAEAVHQGHGRPDLMRSEADFQMLRDDPRFAPLLDQAARNQNPCQFRNEFRQFDFWIGNWSVTTTKEHTPVGVSHIERTIGDCVIWENWTSLADSGYTGKSYNIYNTGQQRWEQFWVDNQGGMIHFHGELRDGVMDFLTDDIPQPDGKQLRRRLRFFNVEPGVVRQYSQGSTDNGHTWTDEYDFTYRRSP
jgi:Tetratricopeptide repeat